MRCSVSLTAVPSLILLNTYISLESWSDTVGVSVRVLVPTKFLATASTTVWASFNVL